MDTWHTTLVFNEFSSKRIFGIAIEDDETAYFCGYHDFCIMHLKSGDWLKVAEFAHGLGPIIWDAGGHYIYLLNKDSYSVVLFDPISKETTTVTGNGNRYKDGNLFEASFQFMADLTQDTHGNIFVCETERVRKIDFQKGMVETVWSGTERFTSASADVLEDGTIYIADGNHHCIHRIKDGVSSTISGTPGSQGYKDGTFEEALFEWPCQILALKDGSLMVVDGDDKSRFRRLDVKQNRVTTLKLTQEIQEVRCMCLDKHGNVYCGTSLGMIYKMQYMWPVIRLLWIGHFKEDSRNCHLANVPPEIIKEVLHQYVSAVTAPPKPALLHPQQKRKRFRDGK